MHRLPVVRDPLAQAGRGGPGRRGVAVGGHAVRPCVIVFDLVQSADCDRTLSADRPHSNRDPRLARVHDPRRRAGGRRPRADGARPRRRARGRPGHGGQRLPHRRAARARRDPRTQRHARPPAAGARRAQRGSGGARTGSSTWPRASRARRCCRASTRRAWAGPGRPRPTCWSCPSSRELARQRLAADGVDADAPDAGRRRARRHPPGPRRPARRRGRRRGRGPGLAEPARPARLGRAPRAPGPGRPRGARPGVAGRRPAERCPRRRRHLPRPEPDRRVRHGRPGHRAAARPRRPPGRARRRGRPRGRAGRRPARDASAGPRGPGRSSARCPSRTGPTSGWPSWPATRRRSPGSRVSCGSGRAG